MIQKKFWLAIPLGLLVLSSCHKESTPVLPLGSVQFQVTNEIDGEPLYFNTATYLNLAGNQYQVSHLEYYLSDIRLYLKGGSWVKAEIEPRLINPEVVSMDSITVKIPVGSYEMMAVTIGIPEEINYTGSLYPSIENVNMAWPESMGGGYHFMKFEGYYLDSTQVSRGFTVHLGRNGNQVINVLNNVGIEVTETPQNLELVVNLNEWFKTPYTYDFNVDGNYTMGVDSLMEKIAENGTDCIQLR